MVMDHDMEMVRAVLAGQRDAFRHLMERYSGLCRHYLRTHFNFDAQMVQDLTQDIFIKAYQGLPRLRPDSSFKSWLITISRNVAIDHLRKCPNRISPVPLEMAADVPADDPQHVKRMVIQQMAARLPERQREAINLFYFWELTSGEIGKILGVPEGTVRSDLRQARLRLAELLEDQESL